MEMQETERKQKLEMETGNGNWKRKWEQKNAPITGAMFLHSVRGSWHVAILVAI